MRLYDQNGLLKVTDIPTLSAVVIDTLIAASVNDYNPTGWRSVINRLQVTPVSGGSVLTGMDVGAHNDGAVVALLNDAAAATDILTLANESASSLATNRFTGRGGEDRLLLPGEGALLVRVGSRWRML